MSADYKGYKLWTIPAPASGSIWLNTMGILGEFDVEGAGTLTDVHRLTEALRVRCTTAVLNGAEYSLHTARGHSWVTQISWAD